MSVTITVPKNDTNIQLNIAGKSVSEVGSELETLGLMLKAIASTDSSFESGFAYKDEEHNIPHPLPHINYREWEDDLETCFSSNSIIRGYFVEGDMVNVDVDPEFMKWARTDKPLDEFCKEQHDALWTCKSDTPQTKSTGSPIGDYRDGVGAWQTDCDDRYAVRTDSGEVVAYACPLGCEQTDCPWK